MKRRIISFCMAMLMLFSTVPIDSFTAHAAEADGMYFIDESLWLAEGEEPAVPAVETGEWQKTEETQEVPYVCPVAEHTHVYNCSTDAEGKYSCGGHEHSLDCYAKLYDHEEHSHSEACGADCTIAEHVHGEECAHTLGELICGLEEHKHVTDGCAADCAIAEHSHSTDPATVKQVKWVVALKDDAADTYAPAAGSIPVSFYVTTLEQAQNPNGSYTEYKKSYWGTQNGTDDTRAYSIANISQHEQWSTLQDQYAIRAQMVESEVTKFVGQWPEGNQENFSKFTGTIRVGGKNYSGEEYEVQWVTVCWRNNGSGWKNCSCLGYSNSTKYDHLHVDGILTKKVTVQPDPEPEDPTPDNPDPTPAPVPGAINLRKQLSQASDRDETFNFKLYTLGLTSGYDPTDTPVGEAIDMRATVAKGQTVAAIKPLESVQLGFGYYKLVEEPHDRYSQSKTFIGTNSQNDTGALYINIATDGTVKYSRSHASGYTTADYAGIENKAIPTTEVKVTKVWNDNNNQDGKRPETAEIHLLKNSSHMGESYAAVLGVNAVDTAIIDYGVDANGNWTATWKGLPATDFYGNKISYHVEEKMPDEYVGVYTVSISGDADTGFTMTNTHVPEKATVSVRKVWNDNNNRDGIRPASVSVQLKKDGIAYGQPQILSESNKWSYDFTDLPKYEGGQLINYSFAELVYDNGKQAWVEGVPEGYTLSTATDEHTGQILLTNSHEPAKSSITITKTWDDNNNQDNLRDSISLRIYAGSNPLKDANGNDIVLTVYNDETHKFSSVNPVSGTQTPVTLSADVAISGNTWTITVSGLLRNVSGSAQTPITYHIVEDVVPGYTMTDGNNNAIEYVTASGSNGELFAAFTNRHVPEKTSVLVSKVWDDSNNQDGKRPASITVELKNGSTVAASASLSAANNWSYTFENLDKYADGEEIEYTVDEPSVPAGYTSAVTGNAASGFTITNSYSPQLFELTVTKKWEDLNNNDNSRPYAVAVILLKNGQQYGQVAKLGNGRDDNSLSLSHTWTNLPRYENGTIITYTVEEVGYYENAQAENYVEQLPAGYSVDHFYSTQAGHENMFSAEQLNDPDTVYALVVNSYTPLSTSLNIKKTWVDDNDREGLRPESLTFQLWKTTTNPKSIVGAVDTNGYYTGVPSETDGIWKKMDNVTATMTKGEQGSWFDVTVNNLPKYENGNLLYYTVTETVPKGYTAIYSLDTVNDVVHVTNSHDVNFINVTVSKTWDDDNNNDGKRPESVTVKLYANGVYVGDNPTAALSGSAVLSKQADGSWSSHTWPGLYEYYQGRPVVYSVVEEPVAGYTTSYPATSKDEDGDLNLTVLNKHEPEKMSISVTKVWDDNNNQDGIRPASVDASLYDPDGTKLETVTVTAQDNWTATFNTKVTKYAGGNEIVYTVKEDLVPTGYSFVDNDVDKDGAATVVNGHAMLTNKHETETVSVTARKVWNDDNNRDNKRPASVQFHLTTDKGHLGPEYMATLSDSADKNNPPDSNIVYGKDEQGNWTVTWTNLPKYKSGVPIKYVVEEAAVAGYSTSYSRDNDGIITVTNARAIDTTNVTVRKLWQDDNDRDGLRPENITVELMMPGENGTTVPVKDASGNNLTATLSAAGNWYHTFTGLPLNHKGQPIQYSVVETTSSASYTTTYSNDNGVLEITNTHQLETTKLSITKVWDDNNNQDNIRPTDGITLTLYADSVALKDADGNNVVVRVNPNAANENERIVIPYQPKSNAADVHISAAVTVDANDSSKWAIEISGLLKHVSGSEKRPIHYSVVEEPVVGYTSTVANVKDADNNELINQLLLTNKHEPEKISIPVTKLWNDANNQDGKRPASVTIKLYKNNTEDKPLTLSAANNWTGSFDKLDKYADGQPISYTVGEAQVPEGYTSAVTGDAASGFTVTNSYTPETVDVTARKVWKDDDNNDNKRPESVQFHLTTNMGHMGEKYVATLSASAEDTKVPGTNVVIDYATVEGNWTVTWKNLPKYRDGTMINYVVEEAPSDALVDAGYSASYSRDENGLITVTNTRDSDTTNVTVRKLWHDDNDRDHLRPKEVTVQLMQSVNGSEPKNVTLNDKPVTATLSAAGNWYHTFLDLPLNEDGKPIQYSVVEEAVENYTAEYKPNNGVLEITNTHAPLKTKLNITKVWDDNNNQDNIRPGGITMTLYADGSPMKDASGNDVTISISANEYGSLNAVIPAQPKSTSSFPFEIVPSASVDPSDSNKWLITVEGLLQHSRNADQDDIVYSVVEHAINGYTASVSETTSISSTSDTGSVDVGQALTLTNTHVPEKMSISVTKIWDDAYNQDGKRPNSLIVNLYGQGSETKELSFVTLTAQGGWTATFPQKVDKYADGQPIRYIVKETLGTDAYYYVDTDGDEADAATVVNGHATLTNKHVPETVSVTALKVWNDDSNRDNIRPTEVEFHLTTDKGHMGEDYKATLSDSADQNNPPDSNIVYGKDEQGNWTVTWKNLPKYREGVELNYVVQETLSAELAQGKYSADYSRDENGLITVTNTRAIDTTSVTVRKLWKDDNNRDGLRPEEVTVKLMQPGENNTTVPVRDANGNELSATLSATGNWHHSFEGLPLNEGGQPIQYSVVESNVNNYTASYEQEFGVLEVINSHAPLTTTLSITKVWDDNNNQDGKRPEDITFTLYADGSPMEDASGDYVKLKVDATGARFLSQPKSTSSFPITLGATFAVQDHNTWLITLSGLLQHSSGSQQKDITYNVVEEAVVSYTSTVSVVSQSGLEHQSEALLVTNRHVPEKTSVSVTKVWDDNDNQDGKRPASIDVQLYKNGAMTDQTLTLSADNNWSGSFENLDKYQNGQLISYTVSETQVPEGYSSSCQQEMDSEGNPLNSWKITNTHDPETFNFTVHKVWDDYNDNDAKRPAAVAVELMKNGQQYGEVAKLGNGSNDVPLSHTWTNLPRYENGTIITYTIEEVGCYENADDAEYIHALPAGYSVDHFYSTQAGHENMFSAEQMADLNAKPQVVHALAVNKYTPERTSLNIQKRWTDDNDREGLRPESITFQLWKATKNSINAAENNSNDIPATYTKVPSAENGWTKMEGYTVTMTKGEQGRWFDYTVNDLPKYENGNLLYYTVTETVPNGYTANYSLDTVRDIVLVENVHEISYVDVDVRKVWNDNNNQDGIRPENVTVKLYANGVFVENNTGSAESPNGALTLNEANNWSASWNRLYKFYQGQEILYTVVEEAVDGYTASYEQEKDSEGKYINRWKITNTHIPETTSVSVYKVWNDDNNRDNAQPAELLIALLANGVDTQKRLTLNAENLGMGSFTNLPKNENGEEIAYTVKEVAYKLKPDSELQNLENGEIPKTALSGLFSDNRRFTDGYTPLYEQETDSEGKYINRWKITNTHVPEKVSVNANKVWDDDNNRDKLRPSSVYLHLIQNNQHMGTNYRHELSESNGWSTQWTDLPKYYAGERILYTVAEEIASSHSGVEGQSEDSTSRAISDYQASYEQGKNDLYHWTVTNRHDIATTELTVTNVWDDDANRDRLRTDELTITLMKRVAVSTAADDAASQYSYEPVRDANGNPVTAKLNSQNNWGFSWLDLPKNENGQPIVYSVAELPEHVPSGYSARIKADEHIPGHFVVTNTHIPETTSVKVSKIWDDDDDRDGIRPEGLIVQLYVDGVALVGATAVLDEYVDWSYTWQSSADMPLYFNRSSAQDNHSDTPTQVEYSVAEIGYIEKGVEVLRPLEGYDDPNVRVQGVKNYEVTLTNKHAVEKTSIEVSKVWDDAEDNDRIRPASVEVTLKSATGADYGTVTLSDANQWKHVWTELYVNQGGVAIEYLVEEAPVEGYTASYAKTGNSIVVTNTHEPAAEQFVIEKIWRDNNNAEGYRPAYVNILLYKNGVAEDGYIVLSKENGWKQAIDLPVYENGEEITWTIKEAKVPRYYSASYDQENLTVTNTIQSKLVAKTGDYKNPLLWLLGLGGCMAGAGTMIVSDRKKKRKDTK